MYMYFSTCYIVHLIYNYGMEATLWSVKCSRQELDQTLSLLESEPDKEAFLKRLHVSSDMENQLLWTTLRNITANELVQKLLLSNVHNYCNYTHTQYFY